MSVGKVGDVAPVRRKRRSWTRDEKRRIIEDSLEEGASIAEAARRHDVNANQLFTWRRQVGVEVKAVAPILPVTIAADETPQPADPGTNGQMEIVLAEGDRIIVWGDVEAAALSRVLKALSQR